ncbi:hypothetical protein PsorP6_002604 [Peronosclerospora sorghi]|uniref:Uncharacterized protein n=1 Tax=Peronosclerospora sorghi TaxID=230839 RepID=A0ACC0WWU8_9STRA|nr:hypothetical protein PsorP6_002604 [Peronosclerospora sorghi]
MENTAYEFQQIQDEVEKICLEIPEKVLTGQTYHASDVHQWTTDISSHCLKELKSVANGSAGFKHIGASNEIDRCSHEFKYLQVIRVLYSELYNPAEAKFRLSYQFVVLLGRRPRR